MLKNDDSDFSFLEGQDSLNGRNGSAHNGMMSAPIVSIDLGSKKIRALAGFLNEKGKVEVLGVAEAESEGIDKGVIVNSAEATNALKTVINDLSLLSGVNVQSVFVCTGLSSTRFTYRTQYSRKRAAAPVSQDDISALWSADPKIELPPGERVIYSSLDNFILDNKRQPKEPVGKQGKKLEGEFQAVTSQSTEVQTVINCLEKAGLKVAGFIPSFMASPDAVLKDEEKQEGAVLLDIGSRTTHIVIYNKGRIVYTAIIPFGSNSITEDIKTGFHLSRNEAEMIKVKAGSAYALNVRNNDIATIPGKNEAKEIPLKTLSQIIQARMEEILDMVMLEIKNSGFENKLGKGIIITGGGSLLKNILPLVKAHTGMETRIGYPVERLSSGMDMQVRNPMYATCIGMVIKGNELLSRKTHNGKEKHSQTLAKKSKS